MSFVWIVLLYHLSCVLTQSNEENDSCSLPDRQNGICKIISNCDYAKNLLLQGKQPQLCGFRVTDTIVCCNEANLNREKTTPLPTGSSVTPTGEEETIGTLSRKKCLDFYPKPKRPIFISGGRPSLPKQFPHMAVIGFGEQHSIEWACGGALIGDNFVLTAAHCLYAKDFGRPRWVRLGDLDLNSDTDDAYPQNFSVKRAIAHPQHKSPVKYHDIGLIELDRKVTLTAYVSPACLNTHRDFPETRLTATGWGNTGFISGSPSSFLLKVDLDYVPNEKCASHFETSPRALPNGVIDDWQICAGGDVGKDTCQRDSGGPLQVPNLGRTFLVRVHTIMGITSFGKACGLSVTPAIYTRVSHYVPWIESIVWPNQS